MPSRACADRAETRGYSRRARPVSYAVADASRGVTIMAITDISVTDIANFAIRRPKDPLRGSSILVYDVPNRGSKRIFNLLDDIPANDPARTNDPKTHEDAGLGFCLGRGYSLVWSGWDPGAPRANGGLGAEFPAA